MRVTDLDGVPARVVAGGGTFPPVVAGEQRRTGNRRGKQAARPRECVPTVAMVMAGGRGSEPVGTPGRPHQRGRRMSMGRDRTAWKGWLAAWGFGTRHRGGHRPSNCPDNVRMRSSVQ